MIKQETYEINGTSFTKTYSDAGFYIHGGSPEGDYEEAVDLTELGRIYTETDIPIETDDEEEETPVDPMDAAYAEAGKILLGVK